MIDWTAGILLILLAAFGAAMWKWSSQFQMPHFKFSDLSAVLQNKPSVKERYDVFPVRFLAAALILFSLAFLDPHYYIEKRPDDTGDSAMQQVKTPSEGIAIYLVLDQSGSMSEEVRLRFETLTRMDLLKRVTKDFVVGDPQRSLSGRRGDMLGLVGFSRVAQILAPLTLDHQAIVDQLNQLKVVTDIDQDGTAIGYAIYKTAGLIAATRHYAQELAGEGKPAYEIKNSIMILVTDGLQAPNPLDVGKEFRNVELLDAARFAKDQDVRVYIINVEPRIALDEFSAHRNLMKEVAEMTGGKFYLADQTANLEQIYADIDRLEKSVLPMESSYVVPSKEMLPHLYRRVSFYPYLIAAGMFLVFAAIFLETRILRKVP
jgi:Ca-activated chloride channel homolog